MNLPDPAIARSLLWPLAAESFRTNMRLGEIELEREAITQAALMGDAKACEQLEGLKREAAKLVDHGKALDAAIAQVHPGFEAPRWSARRERGGKD